ncbi:TSUP family transporter [Amycolatopsis sp. 195334CR]|uniref:TSUP family transporter n=1 Tax=Amycolatopsis sp. 195334CR TaxID=2814588 RepID=UPI001A8DB669|nr:TSUP family transporter [Amycolatopsis sp. 195334CR]MBN6042060.1 TSUP family transporter [Amycolatopsis sp. 195334CR]
MIGMVALAVPVGLLIGAVGVGGVLLPPALVHLAGFDVHAAAGTSSWAFLFTGVVGTLAYARSGTMPWPLATRLALGAAPAAAGGALVNGLVSPVVVWLVLGSITLGAGLHRLRADRARRRTGRGSDGAGRGGGDDDGGNGDSRGDGDDDDNGRRAGDGGGGGRGGDGHRDGDDGGGHGSGGDGGDGRHSGGQGRSGERIGLATPVAVGVGVVVGFGSALTGTGGPVLLVPVLMVLGVAPLAAVGAGQVIQVPLAVFAVAGYGATGSVHFGLGAVLGVVAAAAVVGGARIARRLDAARLGRVSAVILVGVGVFLFAQAAL